MIVEKRVYSVSPGRVTDLIERFRNDTNRLFRQHGMKPLVFFQEHQEQDTLTYFLGFDNEAQREQAWEGFLSDPEWQDVKAASESAGPLVIDIDARIIDVLDISSDWTTE